MRRRLRPIAFALAALLVDSADFILSSQMKKEVRGRVLDAASARPIQNALMIIHTCLVPPGQTTGQLYTRWEVGTHATGSCQGTSSWAWIERIATTTAVMPTPPQTPGVAQLVDSIRGAAQVEPRPVSAAEFERAAKAATPIVVRDFVFPRGVFPQEQQMLARGAAQPSNCPAGSIYVPGPQAASFVPAADAAVGFLGPLIQPAGPSRR